MLNPAPGASTSVRSETAVLRHAVLKHARDAMIDQAHIQSQWRALNYTAEPDFARLVAEYDAFAALLQSLGVVISWLPQVASTTLDSMYTRDSAFACPGGVILCNMGKPARHAEPDALASVLQQHSIPIHGRIQGEGRLEGGDVFWLGQDTVAVGRGYRTNAAGIAQLRELLHGLAHEIIEVPLPHWHGADDVFHLMSMVSPIDDDLILVYSPLLPVVFREALLTRGFTLVEVPDEEFERMACNVLAVAPRVCIALAGNPVTCSRLQAAGVVVHEYQGAEISAKGCGGPTCLVRPILRGPAVC